MTGPGGVGKTRLSLHVGHSVLSGFPDGVWFVELASIRDAGLLEPAIASTLGVDDSRARGESSSLGDKIAGWRALVILDNCEHLVQSCAAMAGRLLHLAPHLHILTTSREPLRMTGEQVLPLYPLQTPSLESADTPQQVTQYPAVQLLLDRARAVEPAFIVDRDNVEAVKVLVHQLDGLPLAIELAAARLRSLSAGDIVRRLDNRYRLFTSQVRDAPARHYDLESLVGWSYDLCGGAERRLWERMSAFAGPADLDAIETVCCGDDLQVYAVADLVDSLLAKSILIRTAGSSNSYRMLSLVQEYGRAKLAEHGETTEVLARHAAYYRDLVMAVARDWFGPDQATLAQRLLENLPNLRAAMDFYLDGPRDGAAGTMMAAELWRLWTAQGMVRQGHLRLRQALEAQPPPAARRKAMWVLGWIELAEGQLDDAMSLLQCCAEDAAAAEDAEALDYATMLLAAGHAFLDRLDAASDHIGRALDGRRRAGDIPGIAIALYLKAEIDWGKGDFGSAFECGLECEQMCAQFNERWAASYGLWMQSLAQFMRGKYSAAIELGQRSIRAKQPLHDTAGVLLAAEAVCWAYAAEGHVRHAAELEAAIQPMWATTCSPLLGFKSLIEQRDHCSDRVRAALGEQQYRRLTESPSRISLDRVVELALADANLDEPRQSDASGDAAGTQPLTDREWQVARLIAEGLANKEIASRLHVARRTVEVHVANIMRKLEVNSRVQIATWYATAH
ncbi:ATP-binding protein [Mycobacterium branderi]|uniref:ATP-binding protein n=1 Tax=Mycobacterium branderi TaxID=43348 RepID=UPI0013D05FCC|nr:LuxR C-terminal-related transcriptional regulator [Mycobacterium branderi]MCV7236347.1 hypothetical protein [Mycobacterium branderi]